MSYEVAIGPVSEPITAADIVASGGLHVTDSVQEAYIDELIAGIRSWLERTYDKAIMEQTIVEKYDYWPECIELTVSPLDQVSSIEYYDIDGVKTVWPLVNVFTKKDRLASEIWLRDGFTWPDLQANRPHAIEVTYTAGYSTVPYHVIQKLKLAVMRIYLTESDQSGEVIESFETSGSFAAILQELGDLFTPEIAFKV